MQQQRRKRARFASRGFAGMLLTAWLGLGLQPCLVAAAEHACPHCPPGTAGDLPAHHDGQEGHAHHADAEAETTSTCASMQSDCCDAGSVPLAKRAGGDKPDLPDSPVFVAATYPSHSVRPLVAPVPAAPPEPRARSAPIYVQNCVYLK